MYNSQRINRKFKNIKEVILINICIDKNMHGIAIREQIGYEFEGELSCVHGRAWKEKRVETCSY